jgi:hypothetical protein
MLDKAIQYAQDVVEGKEEAPKEVRIACEMVLSGPRKTTRRRFSL